METYENFCRTVCRVCLCFTNNENMISLIKTTNKDELSSHGKAVETFGDIRLENRYLLPSNMCQGCLHRLKQTILFKKSCENSTKILEKFIVNGQLSEAVAMKTVSDYLNSKKNAESMQTLSPNLFQCDSDSQNSSEDEIVPNQTEHMIHCLPECSNSSNNKVVSNGHKPELFDDIKEFLKIISNSELFPKDEESLSESSSEESSNYETDTLNDKLENDISNSEHGIIADPITQRSISEIQPLKRKKKVVSRQKWVRFMKKKEQQAIFQPIKCKVCNKVLPNLLSYKHHVKLRHKDSKFTCELCGKIYAILSELRYHLASAHKIGPCYVCNKCTYKTYRKSDFNAHERYHHTGERPFSCDKCGLTFSRRYTWKVHSLQHTEKTVQCTHCPKKFFTTKGMKEHVNNVHERAYVYMCSECDVTYAKNTTVRKHLVEKHGIAKEQQGKIKRVPIGTVKYNMKKNLKSS